MSKDMDKILESFILRFNDENKSIKIQLINEKIIVSYDSCFDYMDDYYYDDDDDDWDERYSEFKREILKNDMYFYFNIKN